MSKHHTRPGVAEIHNQALQIAIDELVDRCRHSRHAAINLRVRLNSRGEVVDFDVYPGELDLERTMAEPPRRVIEHGLRRVR